MSYHLKPFISAKKTQNYTSVQKDYFNRELVSLLPVRRQGYYACNYKRPFNNNMHRSKKHL